MSRLSIIIITNHYQGTHWNLHITKGHIGIYIIPISRVLRMYKTHCSLTFSCWLQSRNSSQKTIHSNKTLKILNKNLFLMRWNRLYLELWGLYWQEHYWLWHRKFERENSKHSCSAPNKVARVRTSSICIPVNTFSIIFLKIRLVLERWGKTVFPSQIISRQRSWKKEKLIPCSKATWWLCNSVTRKTSCSSQQFTQTTS